MAETAIFAYMGLSLPTLTHVCRPLLFLFLFFFFFFITLKPRVE